MKKTINPMFFSPTGTTQKIVMEIARGMLKAEANEEKINSELKVHDFTNFKERDKLRIFDENDIVILGVPVIAGRVPNVLLKYIKTVKGNGAIAVPVVLYGNRNFDDALIELADLLSEGGFKVVAAGAFIGEHSFSRILAKGRPDDFDLEKARGLGQEIIKKLENHKDISNIPKIKGEVPYRDYYKPKDKTGQPVDIRKVKPKTSENCNDCKICVQECPMGSIDEGNPSIINGICIKCCACIKKCEVNAKYFDDPDFLRHKEELEIEFAERKEPEIFI